jgi:hypothetical protein
MHAWILEIEMRLLSKIAVLGIGNPEFQIVMGG